jgi:DNA invertase Pin-like site-specific DNA recombinase
VSHGTGEQLAVEQVACPTCRVPAGRPCRTASGRTAFWYHTSRLVLIPDLGNLGQLAVPRDRSPGALWTAATAPPPAVCIGYAYSTGSEQDTSGQEAALRSAGCIRTYVDRVAVAVAVRPALEEAMATAATQQRCAKGQRVILAVHTLNRLARHSSELIRLATTIRKAGLCLRILTGPLRGIHDAETDESAFFETLAVAARLDHEYVAEKSKAGARAASAAGTPAGRPRVLDEDMLTLARELRDQGLPIPEIARQLVIPHGRNAGRHPSLASVYRALAQPDPVTAPEGDIHDDGMDQPSSGHARRGGD